MIRNSCKLGPKFMGDPKNHGMSDDPLRGDTAIMQDLVYTLREESKDLQKSDEEESKLVLSSRLDRIARNILSKDSPVGMFKKTFQDIRERAKKYKEEQAQKAGKILAQRVKKALEDKGLDS